MNMAAYAVIRVRGQPDVNYNIETTMHLFGLNRVNNCAIVPENPSSKGMLQVIKDYCTYGEIDAETLAALIRSRGKAVGNAPITDDYVKEKTEFASIDALAAAIIAGEYRLKDVEGMKPMFCLHPPVQGYEGNKRSFAVGDALGYRGAEINNLIKRML